MSHRQADFGRLYEERVWDVYGFVAYRVRDRETAEDLTQATFERALRAWSRFDPRRGSERTWLFSIARNLVIDHYRRGQGPEAATELPEATVPGPEERLGLSSGLLDALAQLSDREREVLALRFGGDLNGPEIAELLDLSLANVQQLTSRALRKLRDLLPAATEPPRQARSRAR